MRFTDIFIRRPVLATVISLLIFFVGLQSLSMLHLRQFPDMKNTVITVTTTYPGANAQLMEGFITSPLQKAIAGADGVDHLTAQSFQNFSQVKAHIKLNFDPNQAYTSVMGKVAEVKSELPKASNDPIVKKETGNQIAMMYISLTSPHMSTPQITDYIERVIQPNLATLEGVAKIEIFGGTQFAMRVWLNPMKMAAQHISATQVITAIRSNQYQAAPGQTKGEYVLFNVNAETDLHDVSAFENLIIRHEHNHLVRLKDVAKIELGSQNYDSNVNFSGDTAVFLGVHATPSANALAVIDKIRATMPKLAKYFPPDFKYNIAYDATKYVRASIKEVMHTVLEASIIVIAVIFLFLGALRTVLIPVVTIPLSLVGVASIMLALGYSLNLLTLLAMVLAIGLVVDDAIVVVENIYRHIEDGKTPYQAAIKGAREIAVPVISMTITLFAVYTPIGLMTGVTGALFTEFAFTLAFSVIISGVIALTLSPMMCSKLLNKDITKQKMVKRVDKIFNRLQKAYQTRLERTLNYKPVTVVFALTVLVSCYFMFITIPAELAPEEDQSIIFVSATAPEYANLDYLTKYTQEFDDIFRSAPELSHYFLINGMGGVNKAIAGMMLKPWDQRSRSQQDILPEIQAKLGDIAGLNVAAFPLPSVPVGGDGLPIQFVLTTTNNHKILFNAANELKIEAQKSGLFMFVDSDLNYNKPELDIQINRDKAGELGITMQSIGDTLATFLGGNYVNRFSLYGHSYQVIPQVSKKFRLNPEVLKQMYVPTSSGKFVPLSTIVTLKTSTTPNKLNQFQQLNSATLQGMLQPGHTMDEALTFLRTKAQEILPHGISYDYAGQSRQFMQEGHTMVYTFFFSLFIIFLVLSAQFESFRDPFIILISVPMSICGALIPLHAGLSTLNIYTNIGLITLVGLISKHGILMVDFANKIQEQEGKSIEKAIIKSASLRLRPILMTTASMVLAVTPLIFANGAGAVSRFNIGIVIASGMSLGTLFTLFVLPTVYTLLATKRQRAPTTDFGVASMLR